MPELPEVETTKRGLEPHLIGATITDIVIRNYQLRWPIPQNLPELLRGCTIISLKRRAKYLLMDCGNGTLILHLGMSGSLRILPANTPPEKHDHFDLIFHKLTDVRGEHVEPQTAGGKSVHPSTGSGRTEIESSGNMLMMRLRDPRRFGAVLWHQGNISTHPLLAKLGPEPLPNISNNRNFNAEYLYRMTRKRSVSIKQCIMNHHIVVGVGNIYANEALFRAGIKPTLPAGKLSLPRCKKLVQEICATLTEAIKQGGSTLRDFVNSDGNPGYFQQSYWVYGRTGERCRQCGTIIKQIKQGQRSSFFCNACQK